MVWRIDEGSGLIDEGNEDRGTRVHVKTVLVGDKFREKGIATKNMYGVAIILTTRTDRTATQMKI